MSKAKTTDTASIIESVEVMTDNGTIFDDGTCSIKNAALFAPPYDAASGHYLSARGNPYSRAAFKSIAESADGAMGWAFHPDLSDTGEREIRKASDAALKITKAAVIESAGMFGVRGDVKFIGKDKASNYEIAKEGRHRLGFSVYIPRPLRSRDGVIEGVDTSAKRPLSVDLVEASSATKDITESVNDNPEQEKKVMTPQEIQAMVDAALKKQHDEIMESLKGDLEAGRKASKQADALQRAQLVESRLSEKKVGADFRTKALVGQLAICESAEAMDAIIDDYKAMLAKQVNPVVESAVTVTAQSRDEAIVEQIEERGISSVIESFAAGEVSHEARSKAILAKFSASQLRRIGNPRLHDAKTRKLRQSVIESWSPKRMLEVCVGRSIQTVDDVTEAAVASSGFTVTNAALLAAIVIEAYDIASEGFVAKELATPYPSTLKTETFPGYTDPDGMTSVAEAAVYPDATIAEKYVAHPTLTKYGVRVLITREEVLFDQKGLVLMRANRVADALAYDAELRRINQIRDSATTSYYPSGAAHALYTAAYGNLLTGNPIAGDYTAFEAAAIKLAQITDANSRRLATNARKPFTILVPSSLEWKAWHAINASGTQLRANANANIVQGGNPFAGSTVLSSVVLDSQDASTWYMAGAGGFQKQFVNKQNIPFEVVQIPQAEIQSVSYDLVGGVRAAIMEALFAIDYRYVLRNESV